MTTKHYLIFITLIFFAIASSAFLYSKPGEPLPDKSQSKQLLKTGPYQATQIDRELIDSKRSTQANNDYHGDDKRVLQTRVWYPDIDTNKMLPVIIHSHGYSSNRDGGAYIAQYLASHGYIVVAANFPLTKMGAPGGPMVKDVLNQPGDISFLIDTLLSWSENAGQPLYQMVDPERIAVMGISLGGMTATLAAYDPYRRDPRIKAVISIAGPSSMFSKRYFEKTNIPLLMLATEQDALINYEDNATPILAKMHDATLVTVTKASHTGFSGPGKYMRWLNNPDMIGCYFVMKNLDKEEPPWLHLLGSKEDGIVETIKPRLCEQDPLPPAMNPLRQHQLTLLSVHSFLTSIFAKDMTRKQRAKEYLTKIMPSELHDVAVQASAK